MQHELDFQGRARRSDPQTSKQAAARTGEFASEHHQKILGSLMTQGPADIYLLAERTGLSHVAVARRLSELERMRVAEPTGETVPTPTGRRARQWRAR